MYLKLLGIPLDGRAFAKQKAGFTAGFKAFQAMRCDSGAWEAKLRRETSPILRYDSLLAGPDGGALGEECGCAFGFVVGGAGLAEVAGFVG